MDVKLNINLNSNLMNLGKSGSAVAGGANLSSGTLNLKNENQQSGDKVNILREESNLAIGAKEG